MLASNFLASSFVGVLKSREFHVCQTGAGWKGGGGGGVHDVLGQNAVV